MALFIPLPCSGVDVVAVQVVHQAVLVITQRLEPSMDKHAATGLVVHAAVSITPLHHRSISRQHLP